MLEVDEEKRRISLGLKQAQANPWEAFAASHPVGSTVEGEVKNATEFGLFVGLEGDVDGMVHMSDIAWGVSGEEALALHRKGEMVKAQVLDVDVEKERISLGMKQLEGGGAGARRRGRAARRAAGPGAGGVNKGDTLTVTVRDVQDGGLDVQVGDDGATGFVKRTDLGRDRDEQRPERFQVGQKFDAHGDRLRPLEEAEFLDQGAADRRGEAGGGAIRLVGFGRVAGRHPRRGAEGKSRSPRKQKREAGGQAREGSEAEGADKASGQGRKGGKSRPKPAKAGRRQGRAEEAK